MVKVVHLTSAHPRYDVRIFIKECQSLCELYEVLLVVADGKGDEIKNSINIYDVGKANSRINRIFKITKKVLGKALQIDADIYHLHDPELLLIANKLKKVGKKVIFDAHEDLPAQILSKPYLKPWKAKLLSMLTAKYEKMICSKLDGIIAATPFIKDKFLKINKNTLDVNNYPLLTELYPDKAAWEKKYNRVCYIGGISRIRGIREIIDSLIFVNATSKVLSLVGSFSDQKLQAEIEAHKEFEFVDNRGQLERNDLCKVLSESVAGLVVFLPVSNHINAQPNKMFEYMSAGIPVIASNFPLWREIVEGNACGVCVDPTKPEEIAKAISFLISNPHEAQRMGVNGRGAVEKKYNWESESKKLLNFYKSIQ